MGTRRESNVTLGQRRAHTMHTLQDTSLDDAFIDLSKKSFAYGYMYVARSCVKTLEGIAFSDLELNKSLSRPHEEGAVSAMTKLKSIISSPY